MGSVFYRRVSTDDQAESGAGLKAQLDACTAWTERAGGAVLADFTDEAVSGAAPIDKRPGLLDALAAIGKGDVLVVAKRDRLGRDPIVVAMIEAAVVRQGGRVVSAAGEGTDGDDPTSVLMRRIVDAFAEYERLVIKARTRAALAAKRRRGQRTGSVPIGFELVDDGQRSKSGRPLALMASPAEAEVVATIRELRAGGMPLRTIAAELDRRGIAPKNGGRKSPDPLRHGRWSHTTVAAVLRRAEAEATEGTSPGRRPSDVAGYGDGPNPGGPGRRPPDPDLDGPARFSVGPTDSTSMTSTITP